MVDPSAKLQELLNGYQVTQTLHVAAVLGLSDLLAGGPRTAADLADEASCDQPSLLRLLRALCELGLYAEQPDGSYLSTDLGDALRDDGLVAGRARHVGSPSHWQAWSALEHSVRTGENAFVFQHGQSVWEYRTERPEEGAIFDAAMTANSRLTATSLLAAYDFTRFETLVDVGGGRGALIAAILGAYPSLRGVLFDQPHVVPASPLELGESVAERCTVVGGDFFISVPEGADAYLLRAVIHDWEDADAVAILQTCRRAMSPSKALLLVERILDQGPDLQRKQTALSDLNMLVAPGGRERDRREFESLLADAGFALTRIVATRSAYFVIEATPSG